jgi:hypothetical protein
MTDHRQPEESHHARRPMRPRVGRYLIYGLLDPRTSCLCYVGKTHKRRELRLAEHIAHAEEGATRPVYVWIRDVLKSGLLPEIFVLNRVSPDSDWRQAEKDAIDLWCNWPPSMLPYTHPPQTPKSREVVIQSVNLLNVHGRG